ncbi:MAG: type IV pilus assembly protein PilM [Deltaproteobacteria bacterium]|nr:type IV pilus assembly protein PilM [Deltaproteobacteria bacterium]
MFFKPQKNLVGIDIGSSSVKMVELKEINGEYHLENIGMASIPSEAIVDNTIMESISIVEAIKGLIKANKIKTKNVSSSISGSSVIIRKILLPVMSAEELDSTIQWEAEQYIPFEMSDVNIDYQILGPSKNDATQMNILLVAAKKDVINDYVMMFHELGMVLKVVDVDGFALENSYEENYEGSKEGIVALINIGASAVNVNVVQDGMSVFTRDLQAGGNMINDELQKNLGLSGEKAEMVKLGEKVDGVDPAAALEVIERAIDNLCLEIQRSLDFFSATSADDQVEKVFISGGVSINPRVRESLEVVLGIPVRVMDPFVRIHLDEGRFDLSYVRSISPFFAVATGLAMRRVGDK